MPRVKRGTVRRAQRKKLANLTKGYFLKKSKLYKFMKEAADRAGRFAYRDRRQKKREFRRLWIVRIGAVRPRDIVEQVRRSGAADEIAPRLSAPNGQRLR